MRLTYEEFKTEILNNKEAYLPEELKDAEVFIEHVDKLNHSYDGLMFRMPGSDVTASLDLNAFYRSYETSFLQDPFSEIKEMLAGMDLEKGKMFQNVSDVLQDYATVKNNLFVRCSSAVRNTEALKNCPHRELGDLAFTAHVGLNWAADSTPAYTTMVSDRMLDSWGISKEELFRDAVENAAKRMPVRIQPLSEVLMGMMAGQEGPDNGLYVLTNSKSMDGAAAVIYPGVLDEIQGKIGDFYMIPSSIHEFLLLSDEADLSIDALEAMVHDVNSNVLKEDEFLSNTVYHYDGREKIMEPAHDFVKRRALEQTRELNSEKTVQESKSIPISSPDHPGKGLTM